MESSKKRNIMPFVFLAPFLIIFVVFMAYPTIYSIAISFMKFKAGHFTFNGIKNFSFLFTDPLFYKSIKNTIIILIIQVPLQTIFVLIVASFLNIQNIKFKGLFRMFTFMPVLIDTVSYSIVFGLFFNAENGLVNKIIELAGGQGANWLNVGVLAKAVIIIALTWRWTGYNTVIILGGLQNISSELYEAASIDGASKIKQFFYITIPGVKQVLMFSVILSVNGTLQLFTEPYLLTAGGPVNETLTVVQYLYNTGFRSFNFGVASAGSYVLAIMIGIVTLIQMKVTKED